MDSQSVKSDLPKSTGHRLRSIDGLRGVAVMAVLLFHLDKRVAPGGGVGVDIFFVISGFVITKLLVNEWLTTGTISFRRFYARRAIRLVPAYTAFLACAAVLILALGRFRSDLPLIPVAWLYLTDIWQLAQGQKFPYGTIGHSWTLAIEEHFYLVWPLILLTALKVKRKSIVMACVGIGLIVPALLRFYLTWADTTDPTRISGSPLTRADQLLMGCMAAFALFHPSAHRIGARLTRIANPLAIPAFVAFLGIIFFVTVGGTQAMHLYGLPLQITIHELLAVVVIICLATNNQGMLSRLLATKPFVALGTISYSLYLWHFLLFQWVRPHITGLAYWERFVLEVPVAIAVGAVSWYFTERPFMRMRAKLHAKAEGPIEEVSAIDLTVHERHQRVSSPALES